MSFLRHLLPAWKRGIEDKRKANAAILASIDRELKATEQETIKSKMLMSLNTAEGEWLDQYGRLFGVLRRDSEDDNTYRNRIIAYVLLKRGTIPAIKAAIQEFLNDYEDYIEIYEPYKNVFTLNKSKLNGPDHFLGKYYTIAVIDIRISRPFPMGIVDVINEFKPAGVSFQLTYRPSYHNPNAGVVSLPLDSSEILAPSTKLTILNGMNDQIKGHLNLTNAVDRAASGLFTLNKSKLNSLDRLAGSLSAAQANYHLATFSTEELTITDSTKIEDILNSSEAVSSDFYTKTGRVDGQYAAQTVYKGTDNFIYLTMDIATYFAAKYSPYLKEIEPSGVYTKETYASLMDDPYIQYKLSAVTSSSVGYDLQAFNLSQGEWDNIHSQELDATYVKDNVTIDNVVDYLSDNGLMFIRLAFLADNSDTVTEVYQAPEFSSNDYELVLSGVNFTDGDPTEVFSGNYEKAGETFDIRLDFFELGFFKEVGRRFTDSFVIQEITGIETILDKSVTYTTYSGIESTSDVYEFVIDGGTETDHTYTETIDGNYKEF